MTDRLGSLHRLRWGVRGALALGVAASIAANILHAEPSIVARAISAWSPVALLITIELVSRVPVHRRWLAVAGRTATAAVAGVAAYVSYFHMVAVALRYGETSVSAHLLPLSVDGLVVVASIALLEVGGQIRAELDTTPAPVTGPGVRALIGRPVDDAPVMFASDEPDEITTVAAPEIDAPATGDEPATSAQKITTRRRRRSVKPARGTGRTEVARVYAEIPADDPRTKKEIAADIAAATGLAPATVKTYLGELHAPAAEVAASNGAAVAS